MMATLAKVDGPPRETESDVRYPDHLDCVCGRGEGGGGGLKHTAIQDPVDHRKNDLNNDEQEGEEPQKVRGYPPFPRYSTFAVRTLERLMGSTASM